MLCLQEHDVQSTGKLGDGLTSSLAVLMKNDVQIEIEVTRNVDSPPMLWVDYNPSAKKLVIGNASRTCFDGSSLINGMSSKRNERVSDAPQIWDTLIGHLQPRPSDGNKRFTTVVTLSMPFAVNVKDFWFLQDHKNALDICRSQLLHVQAKISESQDCNGEIRIFEAGLYLEHEKFPGYDIHLNVARSGERVSATRDRNFIGWDAFPLTITNLSAAKRLAGIILQHVGNIGPRATSLLIAMSKSFKLDWPMNVVPTKTDDLRSILPSHITPVVVSDTRLCDTFDPSLVYENIFFVLDA